MLQCIPVNYSNKNQVFQQLLWTCGCTKCSIQLTLTFSFFPPRRTPHPFLLPFRCSHSRHLCPFFCLFQVYSKCVHLGSKYNALLACVRVSRDFNTTGLYPSKSRGHILVALTKTCVTGAEGSWDYMLWPSSAEHCPAHFDFWIFCSELGMKVVATLWL